MCGLVEHRAQQGVATFGYPAIIVGLARLVALRRQADMRADRPGMVIAGTRKPPSNTVPLVARNGVMPPSGQVKVSAPLSVVKGSSPDVGRW